MLKTSSVILLALFILSCDEKPYQEPQKPEQTAYDFSGVVEMGAPVKSTTVSAYQFKDLKRGEKIGEAISNADGSFNLKFKTNYDGPVLLAARGGLYRDLVRDEVVALKPEQELRSVITHIKMPEKTNINAWTTMAVARVQADRGFWDKGVADLKDTERINVDFSHLSYFLSGKEPHYANIARQEPFDATKESFKLDDPRLTLHLAHGGLSRLAYDYNMRLAEDGVVISSVDLVEALVEDLSDRVFDGRNAAGNVVYVGNNKRINLDSYTMRKNLSEAITLYSNSLEKNGKITADDKNNLEKPGKLIHAITWQTQPELFPQAEAPKPLDKSPPILHVSYAGDNKQKPYFAFLSGEVFFDVTAEDDTFVKEVKMLEPIIEQGKVGSKFGPIPIEQLPQARVAAKACDKEAMLDEEIKRFRFSEANIICACFEALDLLGNSKKELSCFQRPRPQAAIGFPKIDTILGTRSFEQGVKLDATISSGLPIAACGWRIKSDLSGGVDEGILPSGEGSIEGVYCSIKDILEGSKFFNGSYYLELSAQDIAGRKLENDNQQAKVYFQVIKEPPQVEISKPALNGYMNSSFVDVSGKVKNPNLVESIEYKIRGVEEKNEDRKMSSRVVIDQATGNWNDAINENLPAGRYIMDLVIADIYGNKKSLEPHAFVIDFQAPIILGPREGVPQRSYLQETMAYNQRLIDNPENAYYMIEPAGEALAISWSKEPTIQRWSTRLDDAATAPVYTIKAHDDHKLKEVRYSLADKCSSLEQSTRIAVAQDDRYEIVFTQNMADVDLLHDSVGNNPHQKYCLSIWAVDHAGHASNHTVEFFWKVLTPPISVDVNASRYKATRSNDDVTSINKIGSMIIQGNPLRLLGNVVVGHAILTNPHAAPISAMLELKKPLSLKVNSYYYSMPANIFRIKYFSYDLKNDKVGSEITWPDGFVVLKSNMVVLAKVVLAQDFYFTNPEKQADFYKNFAIEIGFVPSGSSKAFVDGLTIALREAVTGKTINDLPVLWGNDHFVRKRRSSRNGV